jgi:hypothetical protein
VKIARRDAIAAALGLVLVAAAFVLPPGITNIPQMLRAFSSRILDFQPNSWITRVSDHPPGALLTFVWLDRVGLGHGDSGWASTSSARCC